MPGQVQTIGQRIKTSRKLRGLSIRHAAGLAGIDPSTWSRIETGQRSADNRHVVAAIAQALQCSVADLTGQPGEPVDKASARVARAVHETVQALLDTDLDLPATVSAPRSLGELAADAASIQAMNLDCRYADAAQRLSSLLREAHAHVLGPDRDAALRTFGVATRWSMVTLKCLGHTAQAWVAADRSHHAAAALGDPVTLGVAAWTRGHAATSCGAYARAVAVTMAGIETMRDCTTPGAAEVRGSLHLLAGWAELGLGHTTEGQALLATAAALAEDTGESRLLGHDPHGLAFGPTNVGLWWISANADSGEPGKAVEIAQGLKPGVLPKSRQTSFYTDLGRALADTRQDAQAIRMMLQAERIGPERVHASPLFAETVRGIIDRTRRADQPALTGLASRLGLI